MALDDLRRLGGQTAECWQRSPAGDFEMSERRGRLEALLAVQTLLLPVIEAHMDDLQ
jgi:hypothetical protein